MVIVSDGTGETASGMTRAAITQFKEKEVYYTRYKNVRTKEQIDAIFDEAVREHHMVAYTMVSMELREYISSASKKKHVRSVDLLGPLLTAFSNFFHQEPASEPGLFHAVDDSYFKRVEAMEFTLNHDDGRNLASLRLADIVLVGISRTSKTPLSMYLSLRGVKVVNVPLILGMEAPHELKEVDQRKIIALTIDAEALLEIRRNRLSRLGAGGHQGNYADMSKVSEEVEWANKIFAENKKWPVFNVTNKAVEETAAEIIKLIQKRIVNPFKK